jgi:RHS repeat-associated protein
MQPFDEGQQEAYEVIASRSNPAIALARRVSRTSYERMSASSAKRLDGEAIPDLVASADPTIEIPTGGRVSGYLNPATAQIELPGGRHAVAVASMPLATEGQGGDLVPLELGLKRTTSGFAPTRAYAHVRIPQDLDEGISLSGAGVSLTPLGADGNPLDAAGALDENAVFYANSQPDTDTTVKPTPDGFETSTLLRSVESPETLTFEVGLSAGARLVASKLPDGTVAAAVQSIDHTYAVIETPTAQDAGGQPVPVSMGVAGDKLTLKISHREGDYQYPIDVDPAVADGELNGNSNWRFEKGGGESVYPYVPGYHIMQWQSGGAWHMGPDPTHNQSEWGAIMYPTQGESRIYALWMESSANDGAAPAENRLLIFGPTGWEAPLLLPTAYGRTANSVCIVSNCEAAGGNAGNVAAYYVNTTGTGSTGEATVYAAVAYVVQNNGPSVGFDTTSEQWGAIKNGLYGAGAWVGPTNLNSAQWRVNFWDPGVGIKEVTYSTPGREWKENPGCNGPVQCPESVSQIHGSTTSAGPLPDGEDTITVRTADAMGSTATTSAKVKVDGTAPTELELSGLPPSGEIDDANKALIVKAKAKDGSGTTPSSGIASFKLTIDGQEVGTANGKCAAGPCTASGEWTLNAEEYAAGKHTLTVTATDAAKNVATTSVTMTVHHASPVAVGPGEVNPVTGDFDLEETDVSTQTSGASLRVTRALDSREPTAGAEGVLGAPWTISFAGAQSLEVSPTGNVVLRDASGHESVFTSTGGGKYASPVGDAGLTLTKTGNEYVLSRKGATTGFNHVSGDRESVWRPTISSGVAGSNSTLFSYQAVGGVVEPVEALAPVPAGVSCSPELTKGCRALTFSYATATTATGEGSSEWGDYNGHLAHVSLTAYDPSSGTMKTTAVAQYSYDSKGRLRAEWDPRISPALKSTYGYDAEGHLTAVSLPGRQPWLLGYGTTSGDASPGRLLWVQRPPAATELGSGKAPANSVLPAVTGSAVVGVKMTVSDGTWTNGPLAYGYQWLSCNSAGGECKAITGATNPSYKPANGDVGHALVVRVTSFNAAGSTAAATAATAPVSSAAGAVVQSIAPSNSLNAISCVPASTTCVASDSTGGAFYSTNVSAGGASTWKSWTGPGVSPSEAVACPTSSLCLLAAGSDGGFGGNLYYATSLGGAWTSAFSPSNGVDAISCASSSFCVVGQNNLGQFRYATSPASTSWTVEAQGTATMKGVHCLSSSFCAISDSVGTLHVATSTTQVESSGWTTTNVDGSTPLNGVACTSTTNCVAVDNKGNALSVTVGGTGSATAVTHNISGTNALVAVACPTSTVCATVDNQGDVFQSTESGKGGWKENLKLGLKVTALSCSSATLCAAVESAGQMISFNPAGGTAQQGETRVAPQRVTIEYGVPTSGAGAPYSMSSSDVAGWAQSDSPVEATAIFPPDEPVDWPAADYRRATVLYLDASDREVNTAGPGGAITTSEYNSFSDVVRTLSAQNRATALKEGSKSAEVAQRLDTQSTYSSEGTELMSTLGPLYPTQLNNGTHVSARRHVVYAYDEGAPATGGPYRLLTKVTEGAAVEGGAEADIRTSTSSYAGQNNFGWLLHKPTSETTDPAGLALTGTTVYDQTSGNVVETRTPAAGAPNNEVPTGYVYSSQFASGGSGNGQLASPAAIARDASGNLWVADTANNRVEEFSASGTFVRTIGTLGTGNGQLKAPEGVAVDSEGHVWVADTGNNRIEKFTSGGSYMTQYSTPLTKSPSGIAFGSGRLYVSDTGSGRIEEYNSSGTFVGAIGSPGTGNGQLTSPKGIFVDAAGTIWVADTGNNRVQQFSAAKVFMQKIGTAGTGEGQMTRPEAVAVGTEGNVFVADAGNSRIDEFGPTGASLGKFGTLGSGEENMKGPEGIALDATNEAFVLDTQNNRVEKWIPGSSAHEANGTGGVHGTQTIYYTSGANSKAAVCGSHPEWAGLPCETRPAAQPETSGVPNLPVTVVTYNLWDEPAVSTETVGSATRATTDSYDAAGRITSQALSASAGTPLPTVSYEYNPETGAQTKQSTTTGSVTSTIERGYNRLGERVLYKDADGNTSTFAYDVDGRLETFNDGKGTQTYSYDPTSGALTRLVDSAAGTFVAAYNADGDVTSITYPNGLVETRSYDATDDEAAISYVQTAHCESKCTLYSQTQALSIHDQALNETSTLATENYSYDEAGRLTRAQDTPAGEGCVTRVYGYDQETNIVSLTTRPPGTGGACSSEGGTVVNHSFDSANRLLDSGTAYDAFGDITSLPSADAGGSALTSSFYADETLAGQTQGAKTLTYGLDPLGRSHLVTSTGTGGTTTTSHYSDDSRAPSWTEDSSGHWTRNIPNIIGLAAIQSSGGAPVLQIEDLNGDVVGTASLSEGASTFLSTSEATEYGVPRSSTPPKYGWLGGIRIATELPSGVIGMGARSYVPQIGRYLQPDPIPGGSANAYAYTYGDPVNTSDPSGEFTVATPSWVNEFLTETAEVLTEEAIQRAAEEKAAREEAEENARIEAEAAFEVALAAERHSGVTYGGGSGGKHPSKQAGKKAGPSGWSPFMVREGEGYNDCEKNGGCKYLKPEKPKHRHPCPSLEASYRPDLDAGELSDGLYYGGSKVQDAGCLGDGGDPTLPCIFQWCTGFKGDWFEAWEQWTGERRARGTLPTAEPARSHNGQRHDRVTLPTAA